MLNSVKIYYTDGTNTFETALTDVESIADAIIIEQQEIDAWNEEAGFEKYSIDVKATYKNNDDEDDDDEWDGDDAVTTVTYEVVAVGTNGIKEVAQFDTLEEAEENFNSRIECDDYLATAYLNKKFDSNVENILAFDGKIIYERFCLKMYGDYKSCFSRKPLNGMCYFVGCISDDEVYEWRGFTEEEWGKVSCMTNADIYNSYNASEVVSC